MEYLYMQRPMPENAKGVTVKYTAIDPNGNFQDIGEATADICGNFGIELDTSGSRRISGHGRV